MSFRFGGIFSFLLVVAAAYGLYLVKWQVHEMKRQNMMIEAEIIQQREALNILQAEWAYLNRPERLRELSEKYLALVPGAGQQMIDIARLTAPVEQQDVQMAESENGMIAGAQLTSATIADNGY